MEHEINFSQGNLIKSTGTQYPAGICMGLVVQWHIAQRKLISDEHTFWSNLRGSLANNENTPLLGIGYARKAIEFQGEYNESYLTREATGEYVRTILNKGGLAFKENIYGNNAFADDSIQNIAGMILTSDQRYFILVFYGGHGGHAIGFHRDYTLMGKGVAVQIFDPNLGKFNCNGTNEIAEAMAHISELYEGMNESYYVEAFG